MRHQWAFWAWIYSVCVITLFSCADDDSFSVSPAHHLSFSMDTVKLDTTFSRVPTATKSFWAYNHSGDGIRCTHVRLEKGNQSGFRVNVNGEYLGATSGYKTNDVEIRKGDSIRIFVELTSAMTGKELPQKVEDNIVFLLESGVEQRVNLMAYSWDAEFLRNVVVTHDSVLSSERPVVIEGDLRIEPSATLTIAAGTTLYFHAGAGMDVYGTLKCEGTAEENVTLRGDRLDRMFAYLPYDYVSGQWNGIRLHESSYNNEFLYTDIHSSFDGIVCDSADISQMKLKLWNSTIHNCQGYGLKAMNCQVDIRNTQISNTWHECVFFSGGNILMNHCTLAQFYPYDSRRGAALYFDNHYPLVMLKCQNSLVTGYADDVLQGLKADEEKEWSYSFDHCILRTPKVETADSVYFSSIIYEIPPDTAGIGYMHFMNIDTDHLRYDFRLDSLSVAIDRASSETSLPIDRNGRSRDDKPDIGCYERN